MSAKDIPFWEKKPLSDMSESEWESLCDGCGRCCLIKMEDEESGRFYFTDVVCALFNPQTCGCGDYANRDVKVPDCVRLTPENIGALAWMPPTCAYRLIHEGRGLSDWHPLVSGRKESVIEAGVSVKGRIAGFEQDYALPDLIRRVRAWPDRWPKRATRRRP